MTKNVIITVKGLQPEIAKDEPIEVISVGTYRHKEGAHYLSYDELDEEGHVTKNRIKLTKDEVQMTKTGQVNTQMFFTKAEKQYACYTTPFGEFTLGMTTKEIHLTEEDDAVYTRLVYALEVNGQHLSECELDIDAKACQVEGC